MRLAVPCPVITETCVCGASIVGCTCGGEHAKRVHLACGACTASNGIPIYDPANDPTRPAWPQRLWAWILACLGALVAGRA